MNRNGFERWAFALVLVTALGAGGVLALFPGQWVALLCAATAAATALLSPPAAVVGFVVSRALGAVGAEAMATTFAKAWGAGIGLILLPQMVVGLIRRRQAGERPRAEGILLAGFLLAAAFSAFFADDLERYSSEAVRLTRAIVLMYVAITAIRSWQHLRGVMWAIILTSGAVSAFGLAQLGIAVLHQQEAAIGRGLTGTFDWVGEAAVMMVLGTAFALWGIGRRNLGGRFLAAGGVVTCIVGTVFTTQRSAVLGLALVVVLSAAVGYARTRRRQFILGGLLLAMMAGAVLFAPPRLRKWYHPTNIISGASTLNRFRMAATGYGILRAYPAGVGLGNDASHYQEFKAPGDFSPRWPQHNVVMQVAVTTGWVGAFCFLGFLALAFVKAWRSEMSLSRRGEHADAATIRALWVATAGMLTFGLFHSTFLPNAYFWLTLGLTWRAIKLAEAPDRTPAEAPLSLMEVVREMATSKRSQLGVTG